MSKVTVDAPMVEIITSNPEIRLYITNMAQGSKPHKLAICIKKHPEGNLKVVHTISDKQVENFLREINDSIKTK